MIVEVEETVPTSVNVGVEEKVEIEETVEVEETEDKKSQEKLPKWENGRLQALTKEFIKNNKIKIKPDNYAKKEIQDGVF